MLCVTNAQVAVKLSTLFIKKQLRLLCRLTGTSDLNIGLTLVGRTSMRAMNNRYRHVNKPTDILAFPYMTFSNSPRLFPEIPLQTWEDGESRDLGDMMICIRYVKVQMEEEMKSGEVEIPCATLQSLGFQDDSSLRSTWNNASEEKQQSLLRDILLHHRLPTLMTHGLCHLLGFTHDNDTDSEVMERAERQVMERYVTEAGANGMYL